MIDKQFWKDKKVLITGHTGFKGSWLSIWLHQLGANVRGYALEPNTEPSLFKLAKIDQLVQSTIGDIRDLDKLKKVFLEFQPEIVIHMAAQPLVRESYENPVDTYSINVMGTVNVLESIRYCKSVKAVVNVTTDKVYENKEWTWGYRENDQLGGYDPYSNSKACSELITSSYINSFFNANNYIEHGVAIASARAGNVIGGGDWSKDRLIPDIFKAIDNNLEVIIRNPQAVRPWQHVLEPLAGYLILLENLYKEGTIYNGAWNFGPQLTSFKSVARMLEKLKSEIDFEYSYEKIPDNYHETQILKLDITKSLNNLNWTPRFDLEKTMDLIMEWYKMYWGNEDVLKICLKQLKEMND